MDSHIWRADFLDGIQNYSKIFKDWIKTNSIFFTIITSDYTDYDVENWPDPEDIIEIKLVNRALQKFYMIDRNDLSENHAYESFIEFIVQFIDYFWGDFIRESLLETSGYLDNLIRKSLIHPLGIGIGYLCLKIANQVEISSEILEEIEISRILMPDLPFTSEEKRALLSIAKREIRLRLALCLAHEIAQAGKKLNIIVGSSYFNNSIRCLLSSIGQYNKFIEFQQSYVFDFTTITPDTIKLTLLRECLKCSIDIPLTNLSNFSLVF